MTVPTAPYATSAQVAMLIGNVINNAADFSETEVPLKSTVTQVISWISSQAEMQFGAAGYKIPFVVASGETWPSFQTNYLTLLTCLGAASYVGGHTLKPAPAVAPGRTGAIGNLYQQLFDAQLKKVYNPDLRVTSIRFRADYYAGTPAEDALALPSGPTTDFIEKRFDPARYMNMWDLTAEMQRVQDEIKSLDIDWDYLYTYEDFDVGLGGID